MDTPGAKAHACVAKPELSIGLRTDGKLMFEDLCEGCMNLEPEPEAEETQTEGEAHV